MIELELEVLQRKYQNIKICSLILIFFPFHLGLSLLRNVDMAEIVTRPRAVQAC
jgi:hypothetical protein